MLLGIAVFIYSYMKIKYQLPIQTFKVGYWARLMVHVSGCYEPFEYLKDFYYIDKFPHYNWLTVFILVFARWLACL